MQEIFWSDEDQKFITLPDGDEATHKQIKDYYSKKKGPTIYKSAFSGEYEICL